MDKATRALAQRVTSLEKIVHKLANAPREQTQESVGQKHNAKQEGKDARATIAIIPYRSEDSRISPTPWWKRAFHGIGKLRWYKILQTGGVIAGIGYAVVTFWQWRDLRHNFQVDQRAWIKATVIWTGFPSTEQTLIRIANTGKSVAISPHAVAIMEIVNAKSEPSLMWKFRPHQNVQFSLDFPGDIEEPFPLTFFAENNSARKLSEAEKQSLTAGTSYVVASGLVIYSDQFGEHWTRFCSWQGFAKDASFSSRPCVAWNAVGDGEPPN
jgi:hypothetical protein